MSKPMRIEILSGENPNAKSPKTRFAAKTTITDKDNKQKDIGATDEKQNAACLKVLDKLRELADKEGTTYLKGARVVMVGIGVNATV